MRKIVILLSVLLALLSTSALALNVADVGGYDVYMDYASNLNGEAEEKGFIAGALGVSVDDLLFKKVDGYDEWYTTDDDDTAIYTDFEEWYFDGYTPVAYLIKSGSGDAFSFDYDGVGGFTPVVADTILFENVDQLRYGLIDLDWFTKTNGNFSIESISHTSAGGGEPIPEPSTLVLLGAGLIGVVALRRRKH